MTERAKIIPITVHKPQPAVTPRLYTVDEVAEMLKLSRSQIYELMNTGRIASVQIGRSRRIEHTEIDAFIQRHRVG